MRDHTWLRIDLMRRAEGWRKVQLADPVYLGSMAASLQVSDLLERALNAASG